ncbi:MAG: hypothetical protein RIS73_813 [Bacteroidota bacterium]|jgi:hypothetical protein
MDTTNNHPQPFITKCFYAAALYNILGSVVFSKFLTNDYMTSLDPNVFSDMGWIAIFLFGLVFLSIAKSYHHVPYLLLALFVEKMIYTGMWILWLLKNNSSLPEIYHNDLLTGIGFTLYGSGDLVSGLFFLWVALKILNKK